LATVLLVDDEEDILAVAKKMLENAGYNIHVFGDPLAALDHIAAGCKDCVITVSDIRMSELSGLELVKKIKQLRPEMKSC